MSFVQTPPIDEDDFASNSAARSPSQKSVGAYVASKVSGGVPANLSASRAFATDYFNNRDVPLFVCVVSTGNNSTSWTWFSAEVSSDGVSWVTAQESFTREGIYGWNISFHVPPNWFYRVSRTAGPSTGYNLRLWSET